MEDQPFPITMAEVTDPEELAKARAQRERFDRNFAWFKAHAAEIFACCRGKCICIAGEELFIADTPEEVMALAQAAHPEDERVRRVSGEEACSKEPRSADIFCPHQREPPPVMEQRPTGSGEQSIAGQGGQT